jgi:hypothetical protein
MTYKERCAEHRRLIENLKTTGQYEKIKAQVDQEVEELLHSPNVKVFREMTGGSRKRHLYVQLAGGRKSALCGHEVNESVASVQATSVRDGDCSKCGAKAKEIFSRGMGEEE